MTRTLVQAVEPALGELGSEHGLSRHLPQAMVQAIVAVISMVTLLESK